MSPSSADERKGWRRIALEVFDIEARAIQGLASQIDEAFGEAVERMRTTTGRIVCTGMGKSGHVMKKVAATLASTGTPALFLHPAEAIHGDLGMIMPGDLVLAASFSGRSDELTAMLPLLSDRGVPIIAITGDAKSPLARHATIHLSAAIDQEACPLNLAPTASTTATLALGDALAMALLDARGFTSEDFAHLHPGGSIGRRLRRVDTVMHKGDDVPTVSMDTPLREAVYRMSKHGFGILGIVDQNGRLIGVLSDGDLRRLLAAPDASADALFQQPVSSVLHANPKTIGPRERVQEALTLMEEHRITALFVCEAATDSLNGDPGRHDPALAEASGSTQASRAGRVIGIVHIHDLWGSRGVT